MAVAARSSLSYTEYLELEARSEVKHTWIDGQVFATSGGTPLHAQLPSVIGGLLLVQLRGGPCRPYSSDLRVRVLETGMATYPDLSVICGRVAPHPEDADAATNPIVVVEVLSRSTEQDDRTWKMAHYRRIASLRDILLVHQDRALVEHYARGEGSWTVTDHEAGDTVTLSGLEAALSVDEIYEAAELAR